MGGERAGVDAGAYERESESVDRLPCFFRLLSSAEINDWIYGKEID
jgi:hypothetical protein